MPTHYPHSKQEANMKAPLSLKSQPAPLSGAWYQIERRGQQPPDQGDNVVVRAQIHVPAEGASIASNLRFGNRLNLGGWPLHSYWGASDNNTNSRYVYFDFVSQYWADAFETAARWAEAEIQRLEDALQARAKALAAAEDGQLTTQVTAP